MLMLTHTWMLWKFLGPSLSKNTQPDIFIHNVSPDMLPIHRDISSDMTHGIARFRHPPAEHRKAAFVQFHLLVDDMAHYGRICKRGKIGFDPHSGGYTYKKGRALIQPIMDFHKSIGQQISYDHATYRSHIIIEMAFDQTIHDRETNREFDLPFFEALNYTVENKMDEFCRTSFWLYGINEGTIAAALKQATDRSSRENTDSSDGLSGRIELYMGKFGLEHNDDAAWSGLENLLHLGMDMVSDYEDFLVMTLKTVRDAGFTSPL